MSYDLKARQLHQEEAELTKAIKDALRKADPAAELLEHFAKGDVPGHEFHGNQYTDGGGGNTTQHAPGTSRETYTARNTSVRGMQGKQSVVSTVTSSDAGKVLSANTPGMTREQHSAAAEHYAKEHARLQSAWSAKANEAMQAKEGRNFEPHDYKVSGVGRSDFAESHKEALRTIAHEQSFASKAREAHEAAAKLVSRRG